jgi:lactaldehyde dehydrogenase/glycolaldehyde dehydrogenase
VKAYLMYIKGQWVASGSGRTMEIENPADESVIATVPLGTAADAEIALRGAQAAQREWAKLPPVKRAEYVRKLADAIATNRDSLASVLTSEQGKPLREALGEVDATVKFLAYAAEHARRIEGDIVPSDNGNEQILIHKVPFGVTVGLIAWNFPLALTARKLGNSLVCGNTMVIKPPEDTPLTVLEMAKLADEIGFPPGVFSVVTGTGEEVGHALVTSPITALVTLTGSTEAGKAVYRASADRITVVRLELGGKAPFIVMDDADIDKAVDAAIVSRFANCGQICTCNERMYIHEQVYDEFMSKFLARVSRLTVGNPIENPDIGPKVNRAEVEKLERMVNLAIEQGARLEVGGRRLREGVFGKGYWFEPTVLSEATHEMDIMKQEIFGPIVPVMRISSFEQALELANDSDYGLSAYLFTRDMNKALRITNELHFGEIYINRGNGEAVNAFHNGFRLSGLGGEDGKYGLEGYLQKKTVYLNYE